ncbi:hypothetical protein AB0D67_08500 [Streptosporangium sp. NPDC048047]|uniref:WXG100-like domain-containing protein n=1 Tax=Streptosporangium sp. NPDC048047 TaxID=3155748 RepID=UPI0034428770
MGVTLPPEVAGIVSIFAPWPNVDEDEIRKDADAWRTVLAGAQPAGEAADGQVRRTQDHYRGDSATELAGLWQESGGDGGHLSTAVGAARSAPAVLDGTAMVVTATKVAVATQAVRAIVMMRAQMLTGGAFGVGAAAATMYATRHATGRILRETTEGAGRVLAPAVSRRVTQPLRQIIEKMRGPGGGGGPMLAGAGGPRVPMGRSPFPRAAGRADEPPGMMLFGRKSGGGGSSGGQGGKKPLNQANRKPHESGGSASTKDKHEKAAGHGGRRNIPENPNKRKKG